MMISIKKKKDGAHVSKRTQRRNTESLSILEERKHLLTQKDDFFTQEAYKTLRSNIIFSLTGEEGNKIIQVTSAMMSEGKSITSVNLAISFAQTDRKVLLIDCDLRRPKLASLLSLGANVGLSNVLVDHTLLEQAILPTKVPNLSVMTSGEIPPNPSELLGSKRMTALLEELRQVYHYIILDTPPVNMVTDAVVLAPMSDGVLFVVRARHSDKGSVRDATEQLEYAKVKILGYVLNGVDSERGGYGSGKYRKYKKYKGYGYGYGYGYSSPPANRKPDPKEKGKAE